MNPYAKAIQSVLRLVAVALVVIAFFLYTNDIYWLVPHLTGRPVAGIAANPPPPRPVLLALKSVPFWIGLVLYCKSRALAERFTKDLD